MKGTKNVNNFEDIESGIRNIESITDSEGVKDIEGSYDCLTDQTENITGIKSIIEDGIKNIEGITGIESIKGNDVFIITRSEDTTKYRKATNRSLARIES